MNNNTFIDLAVIIDYEPEFTVVKTRVSTQAIISAYEDYRNDTRSYIVLITGQIMHIDLTYEELLRMIS